MGILSEILFFALLLSLCVKSKSYETTQCSNTDMHMGNTWTASKNSKPERGGEGDSGVHVRYRSPSLCLSLCVSLISVPSCTAAVTPHLSTLRHGSNTKFVLFSQSFPILLFQAPTRARSMRRLRSCGTRQSAPQPLSSLASEVRAPVVVCGRSFCTFPLWYLPFTK